MKLSDIYHFTATSSCGFFSSALHSIYVSGIFFLNSHVSPHPRKRLMLEKLLFICRKLLTLGWNFTLEIKSRRKAHQDRLKIEIIIPQFSIQLLPLASLIILQKKVIIWFQICDKWNRYWGLRIMLLFVLSQSCAMSALFRMASRRGQKWCFNYGNWARSPLCVRNQAAAIVASTLKADANICLP